MLLVVPFRTSQPAFGAGVARYSLRRSGFSLIEVAIAMGVMAFAGIAVLGFLPTAMNIARSTTMDSVASTIAANVKADLQQVELKGSGIGVRYYTMDGKEVTNNPSADPNAVIQAYRSEKTQDLPGLSATVLKRVSIQIVYNPGKAVLSTDVDGWVTVPPAMESKTFRFYVTR